MSFNIELKNPGGGFDINITSSSTSKFVTAQADISLSTTGLLNRKYLVSALAEIVSATQIGNETETGGVKILNFDAGNLDDIDYIDTDGGTASVDASAHKGDYCAKLIPNGSSGSLALIEEFTNQTEVYARVYIKIPSTFRIPAWEGIGLVTLNANGQYDPIMVIGFGNNTGSEAFPDSIFFDGSDGWTWSMSTQTIAADTWHCLELYWKKGTSGDGIGRAWFNGTQVREVTTLTNQARAGISGIYLGAWYGAGKYSSDDTVYFDSVKVDTSYIGLFPLDYADLDLVRLAAVTSNLELTTEGILEVDLGSTIRNVTCTSGMELQTSALVTRKVNIIVLAEVVLQTSAIITNKINVNLASSMELNTVSLLNVKKALSGTATIVFETGPPQLYKKVAIFLLSSIISDTTSILTNKKNISVYCEIALDPFQLVVLYNKKLAVTSCGIVSDVSSLTELSRKINIVVNCLLDTNTNGVLTNKKQSAITSSIALDVNTYAENVIPIASSNFDTDGTGYWGCFANDKVWNPSGWMELTTFNPFQTTTRTLYNPTIFSSEYSKEFFIEVSIKVKSDWYTGAIRAYADSYTELETASGNKNVTADWQVFKAVIKKKTDSAVVIFEAVGNFPPQEILYVDDIVVRKVASPPLSVKKNAVCTSNISINTIAIQKRKVNASVLSSSIFETQSTLSNKKNIISTSNLTFNTESTFSNKITQTLISDLAFNTESILHKKITSSILSGLSFDTNASLNKKINADLLSTLIFNIPDLDLNTTTGKQVTCLSSSVFNTSSTINIKATINTITNLSLDTTSILSRICRINLLNNIQFETSTSSLFGKKNNTLNSGIIFDSVALLKVRKNVSTNSPISFNTESIITRKVNQDILAFIISEFSTPTLYAKLLHSVLSDITLNTSGILSKKVSVNILNPLILNTQGLLSREILSSIVSNLQFNTSGVLTLTGATSALSYIIFNTEAILKRKINLSLLSELTLNTTGTFNKKFGITVISPIIFNTESILTKKSSINVLSNLIFNTGSSINLKKSISVISNIELITLGRLLRKFNTSILSEVEFYTLGRLLKKYQVSTLAEFSFETLAILDSIFVDLTSGKVHYFDLTINNKIYSLLENLNYELNIDFPINKEILEDISLNSQISDLDLVINSSKKFNLEI